MTLRGAKRGSAGVPVAKRDATGNTQGPQEEFCPSKLLNPFLFLFPAPRKFRPAGPTRSETSWFGIFFLKFLLSKHLSKFNIQTTSKKVGK